MKARLTSHEWTQLDALLLLGEQHLVALEAIEDAAAALLGLRLGSPEDDGTLDEALFTGMPIRDLLARLAITVEALEQ